MQARPVRLLAVALPLALANTYAHATAAPHIEEIVVTGELRESRLLDSAASISVVSLEQQRSGTVNHLEEILGWLPNVNLSSGGSRARFVQIRGIGERGQFLEPLNPSVGLVVDGVDLSGVGVTATLFDVDQVEVLRGPQGTLYGANALAGLINVRSSDPTSSFQSRVQLDAGDYDAFGIGAAVSGPLSEQLGYRLAARQYRDDGFMKNRFLGEDDTGEHDELTLRGKLEWNPTDNQSWTFSAGVVEVDNGYDAFTLDNSRNTQSDTPGRDEQETRYLSANLRWDPSDVVSLAGTLGLSDSDSDYSYDEDWVYEGYEPLEGYNSSDRYQRERDAGSLDLRLLSGPAGKLFGGRTDWVVGVYALDQTVDLERTYTFASGPFFSRYEVERLAVYGELEHALTERTRVILGARGERHSAEYEDSEGVTFDPVDRMVGGRLVLERDVGADALAYLSVTRGYKAGGFNITGTLPPEQREYDPELLWNYEVGLKGLWLDGRLQARAALFTMEREDVQVATFITVPRGVGNVEFIDLISNAAEGSNTGLELELEYRVLEPLTLFAHLGLLDTEFDDFMNTSREDLGGEEQAHAPGYQFFAGLEYRFRPGWYLRLEAEGKDSFYFQDSVRFVADSDHVRSDPYELWHLSLGYQAERFSVKLWGRNLGDEDYPVRGFYFGNDPRDGYTPRGYFQFGEPRRYGVTLTLEY